MICSVGIGRQVNLMRAGVLAMVSGCALAGQGAEPGHVEALTRPSPGGDPANVRVTAGASYSYVAGSKASYYGGKGDSHAQSVVGSVGIEVPLNETWFVPMGAGTFNGFYETLNSAPIPEDIHTLGMTAGIGRRIGEKWTVRATAGPEFYRLSEMRSSDVGVGGLLMAIYRWQPDVTVSMGLSIQPDRNIPVMPAIGARWDISTNLTLNAMFPKPGLFYHANRQLDLFIGAGANFAVFRTDHAMAERMGESRFDHALGTYREFHLGAGAEYRVWKGLSASVEGGYAVGRALDYSRLDERVTFDPAPYVQAALRCRF
jgi:opacity protein-like surface antigen